MDSPMQQYGVHGESTYEPSKCKHVKYMVNRHMNPPNAYISNAWGIEVGTLRPDVLDMRVVSSDASVKHTNFDLSAIVALLPKLLRLKAGCHTVLRQQQPPLHVV